MKTIKIKNRDEKIYFNEKEDKSLYEILEEKNISINSACLGKGTCGKCKFYLHEKHEVKQEEKKFLNEDEIKDCMRLACFYYPKDDIEIGLIENKYDFLEEYILAGEVLDLDTNIKEYLFKIFEGNVIIEKDEIKKLIEKSEYRKHLTNENIKYIAVIVNDEKVLNIEEGSRKELYAVAIDIGTSTIVMSLVDLLSGKELAVESSINPQVKHGLDIISRISYSAKNSESLKEMHELLVDEINNLIVKISSKNKIEKNDIYEIVVAANTCIMHFLFNISPESIGFAPYIPIFLEAKTVEAKDIGISEVNENALLYSLANVSAFIGSDVLAAVHLTAIYDEKKTVLLIDIGTNAEIVLAHSGKLIACSCAAGPAFEAMNISSGIRAVKGAIKNIKVENEEIKYETIDDAEAIGLCGSAVFAVIREFRKIGLIKSDGKIISLEELDLYDYRRKFLAKDENAIIIDEKRKILFTQKDIREVQLAKGAILSGVVSLLQYCKLDISELDKIYIAGQFGSNIDYESLKITGIIPRISVEKIKYLGNTAKMGAYRCAIDKKERKKIEKLAEKIQSVNLNELDNYDEIFISSLDFPELE